jgi:hypothetical protein
MTQSNLAINLTGDIPGINNIRITALFGDSIERTIMIGVNEFENPYFIDGSN